jgi:glycosyltransferase involved in cell wall biosynthesis
MALKEQSNQKLCVAIVSPMAYGLFNPKSSIVFGGSEVQLTFLAKKLAKDMSTHVLVANTTVKRDPERFENVFVHSTFTLRKNLSNYVFAPLQLFNRLVSICPDVVIQRGAGAEAGICAIYCLLFGKRFVYSIAHDMDVSGEFARKGVIGRLFSYGFANADAVVAQNSDQVRLLFKWKPHMQVPQIIKSMYPLSVERKAKKKYVLWVARSDAWKNPQLFLDLAKKFSHLRFVMIMPKSADSSTWKRVFDCAQKLSNVTFIESVPFEKIQKYFAEAILFVNTSEYEGFPNTFVQSCIGKTPIVSYKVNPEGILEKNKIGLCADGSFERLCQAVEILTKNKRKYSDYSENAYTYFLKNHSIDANIKQWKQIISDKKPK